MLRVEGLSSPAGFRDISFSLKAGEVLGLAGLVGAGRSEIAQALFGLDSRATGRVFVRGRPMRLGSPAVAMRAGLGLVPEDRKRQGLVLSMSARANATLAILRRFAAACSSGGQPSARWPSPISRSFASAPRRRAGRRRTVWREPARNCAGEVAGGGMHHPDPGRTDEGRRRRREAEIHALIDGLASPETPSS